MDSQFTHKAWAETSKEEGGLGGELTYPLLADLNKQTCKDYGVLLGAGVSLRGSFLIDPEGKVRWANVNDLSVGRNVDELLRVLDALQSGGLCPCNWKKGEKTLG